MKLCPFLTTSDEKIECFEECPFYDEEKNGDVCPFKSIGEKKKFKVFYNENYMENDYKINNLSFRDDFF
ncbi:hypothetical protein ACFIJ5_05935 [Haloimpatiens sp. FM7330]|uniref:hypothetical protein n=1 Tax=Haloimpatiens sp. FM7330 TaxID=3298610 RepID=UPI0036357C03